MARSTSHDGDSGFQVPSFFSGKQLKRLGILIGIPLILGLIAIIILWNTFFKYVPPGNMLVVISKQGTPLKEGEILAKPGQKGIQEEVLGEGWHFIMPILYTTEVKENINVPGAKLSTVPTAVQPGSTRTKMATRTVQPAMVGIVKALGGTPLPAGKFLAERGERGIQREVLLPGSYRLNPYGYEVKMVPMVEIKPGYIGVLRRKLGVDGTSEFAKYEDTEKGIIKDRVLQPGIYPINTEEYEVIPCEIGIYQTTYHYIPPYKGTGAAPTETNTALEFDAGDGNRIQLDCTIEWELKPEFWPEWLSKYRTLKRIEDTLIRPNVKNITRNRGQDYRAEDFLDGSLREKFQADFEMELDKACKAENVIVRSAFIRNIIIPDRFLEPKRDEQLAKEKTTTQVEQKITAETQNEVTEAERTIKLEVAKVQAKTELMVAGIEREAENIKIITEAELEKMKDEFSAKIAIIDAQRTELLGKAKAESTKLVNTAKSGLYKMKMDVFSRDSEAFLRYTMAQGLSDNMKLRLFQSGQGTLWTNMGNKDLNLFMPLPGGEKKPEKPIGESKKSDGKTKSE